MNEVPYIYQIFQAKQPPSLTDSPSAPAWAGANVVELKNFREESQTRQPRALARLLYDGQALYGLFTVADENTRCVCREFMDPVYEDSCVELFLQPGGRAGYFNFEFSGGGAALSSFITDPTRVPGGFRASTPLTAAEGAQIQRCGTLPGGEIKGPVSWMLSFRIPWSLITARSGVPAPSPGNRWRGNFYKCGDRTAKPHWAAWSPVDALNFHLPACFGEMVFE